MKLPKVFLSLFIVGVLILSFLPKIDSLSYEYHDTIFKRSIAAFAIAKGLNGVISALQGTEVGASFVANVTFSIGEILDPLNDMVERFSQIMLVSSIALGIEKIFIEFGNTYFLKLFFGGVGVFFLLTLWIEKLYFFKEWVGKIFFILVLIRFVMPLTEYANSLIYEHYTEPIYTQSKNSLMRVQNELENIKIENAPKELSFFEGLQKKFEQSSQDMMSLMIIFIFQTIIFPLFLLWICYKIVGVVLTKKLFKARTN